MLVVRGVNRGRGECGCGAAGIISRPLRGMPMRGSDLTIVWQLSDTAGVVRASVSLKAGEGVIEHDTMVVSGEAVRQAVEDMGFDAAILSSEAACETPGWLLEISFRFRDDLCSTTAGLAGSRGTGGGR